METERFGPVELPTRAWRQQAMTDALAARDIAAVLQLAQQYSGASQARLATATGLGQGRLNEIFNGKRQVSRLDVFERIADGLTMPGHARATLGLAPARTPAPATLTAHSEIAEIYESQAAATRELRAAASTAGELSVLAVRVLGLMALNDSLLRGPLVGRTTPMAIRVLLLDPDGAAAEVRAAEIGESRPAFSAGIRMSLACLAELSAAPHLDVQVRLYDALPTWRIVSFDEVLYLSAFGTASEGHRSGMYKLTAAASGVLHAGFRRYFDDLWQGARAKESR